MFYHQESAKYIPPMEAKLANNPKFPPFARLASYYLKEGKPEKVVEVCLAGLRFFPEYPTAHLILGKAYEQLGRTVEAMLEYRKVHRALPDNPAVLSLLRNIEQREQEAFKAFAEERANKLKERRNTLTLEAYTARQTSANDSTTDFLLQRLHQAKQPPTPSTEQSPVEQAGEDRRSAPRIVTATLAEIYANQGEYREALEAYRKLKDQHPDQPDRYNKRIAELEEVVQHAEQKS